MAPISKIAKKYNLSIIEDAAHALGAKHADGSMVGSCKYSNITGFSLHPVKSIAAGEGGIITTNSNAIYKKLIRLRSHGINKLDDKFFNIDQSITNGIPNPWYYEMQELGFNYRITDFQCALGKSQLSKLSSFIKRRRELAIRYDNELSSFENLESIHKKSRDISSHHLYPVRIKFNKIDLTRAELMNHLKEKGIITQVHYIPVTSHPYYQNLGYNTEYYKNANDFYEEALTLPLYFKLKDSDQDYVVETLKMLIEN